MTGARTSAMHPSDLAGYRVLVVEDDYFVAQELCSTLRENGAIVLGPARSVSVGRDLVRKQLPDCVLLDINLNGEYAFDFAGELQARGVRTLFTTGYDASFIPPHLRHTTCLQKPLDTYVLVRNIRLRPPGKVPL